MSNQKRKTSQRVVFADDHTRISPRTNEALYGLENSQVYDLILIVYHNTALFKQFSNTWQQRIRRVRRYAPESYIEDVVLSQWVMFFTRVLMPMEDVWEQQQLANALGQDDPDLHFHLLLYGHPALPRYAAREARLGRTFDIHNASQDQVRDALRWCGMYEKIRNNQYYELYRGEHPSADLSSSTYLQLREIAHILSRYEKRANIIKQILEHDEAENFLHLNYSNLLQGRHGLLQSSERQLRVILSELRSMQRSGICYNESGDLVAKALNSD